MNYIAEILAFERWLETNYLPVTSQLLWYKLIGLFNGSRWSEWIQVDNQRLMAKMQIKREQTFIEHRDKLIESGLIEYQRGRKGCPNRYRYVSLNTTDLKVQSVVQNVVHTVVNPVVQSVANTVDINKHKQNKIKKIDTNVSESIPYQVIADSYQSICVSFPRLTTLSDARKKAIKARLQTYTAEDFVRLFELAESSDFLKGKNDRNWSATFDWLITDKNMVKVLDGNYANKSGTTVEPARPKQTGFQNFEQRNTDYDAMVLERLHEKLGGVNHDG